MIDLLNRNSRHIQLSPFYLCMVAFCFSMTIGVLWEFFECAADHLLNMDMQKDFIVHTINSVALDPSHSQQVVHIKDITETQIFTADGQVYTIEGGYLDVGILDTMKDLFVNFIGAVVFSVFGYIMLKRQSANIAADLMVRRVPDDADITNYAFAEEDGFTDGIDENRQ